MAAIGGSQLDGDELDPQSWQKSINQALIAMVVL
jgi:hypothetical protein